MSLTAPDLQEIVIELVSRYPIPIKFIGVWDTVGALGISGVLNFIGRARFQFHDVAL